MEKWLFSLFCIITIFQGLSSVAVCEEQLTTGRLLYPSEDNIDFTEGTIEFWIKPAANIEKILSPEKDGFQGLLKILEFAGENGAMSLSYCTVDGGKNFRLSLSFSSAEKPLAGRIYAIRMIPGQWQHLALSWKGNMLQLFWNGKSKQAEKLLSSLDASLGKSGVHDIFFGDKWGRGGLFQIDDLRISSVFRHPDELGFYKGELRPDPYTNFLDSFNEDFLPDGKIMTTPEISMRGGILPSQNCRFVEGKYGKAISLFEVNEKQKGQAEND